MKDRRGRSLNDVNLHFAARLTIYNGCVSGIAASK